MVGLDHGEAIRQVIAVGIFVGASSPVSITVVPASLLVDFCRHSCMTVLLELAWSDFGKTWKHQVPASLLVDLCRRSCMAVLLELAWSDFGKLGSITAVPASLLVDLCRHFAKFKPKPERFFF